MVVDQDDVDTKEKSSKYDVEAERVYKQMMVDLDDVDTKEKSSKAEADCGVTGANWDLRGGCPPSAQEKLLWCDWANWDAPTLTGCPPAHKNQRSPPRRRRESPPRRRRRSPPRRG